MTASRNAIFENVRRALGRPAEGTLELRPKVLRPRTAEPIEDEVDRLLREVGALSGKAQRVSADEMAGQLRRIVQDEDVRRATLWPTPRLRELGVEASLRDLGVAIVSPCTETRVIADCDLGVTEADFILPETGTLGLLSSPDKPRAVSLLPRIHLAIVGREALRSDLHGVFTAAKEEPYLVFITGPSRTADIELTVTLGVHGPKALHVWVV